MRLPATLPFAALLVGCDLVAPGGPPADLLLDGPAEGLTGAQLARHFAGDAEFGRIFAASDGLGPVFVGAACAQCHVGDGKGHPAFALTRYGRSGPDGFDPMTAWGGAQLQHRSIPGYPAERVPAEATAVTRLIPPAVSGLGYLDAVDDATLLALADPGDLDGDGLSGRVQIVAPSPLVEAVLALESEGVAEGARGTLVEGGHIGRFGRKAAAVDLLHQTVGAYHQDMGVTSDLVLEDLFNPEAGHRVGDAAADPEVSGAVVADVVFYLKTLRAPPRREADHPEVLAGEAIFAEIGCAGCHLPTLHTGRSSIGVLDRVAFHPYTDLLLHDMGPELDDGYTEGRATSAEWRTTPLWGLGLHERFQGGRAYYLHDGRATTLEQTIELHGGEAAPAREAFRALGAEERAALLRFLRSL